MSSFPWNVATEREYCNKDWTEECQGIACDGQYWYVTSNRSRKHAIYRFTLDMRPAGSIRISEIYGTHAGALCFHENHLYVPMEPTLNLLRIPADLSKIANIYMLRGSSGVAAPQTHMSWCAVNPVDGMLYSSDFDNVSVIHRYDPSDRYRHKDDIPLDRTLSGVQGGCFSLGGNLYLSSHASREIVGFDAKGKYLGGAPINVSASACEEVEGLCYFPLKVRGVDAQVHLILLDNDWPSSDDVILKHYAAANPGQL